MLIRTRCKHYLTALWPEGLNAPSSFIRTLKTNLYHQGLTPGWMRTPGLSFPNSLLGLEINLFIVTWHQWKMPHLQYLDSHVLPLTSKWYPVTSQHTARILPGAGFVWGGTKLPTQQIKVFWRGLKKVQWKQIFWGFLLEANTCFDEIWIKQSSPHSHVCYVSFGGG